jgi:enoyl-CoA hydratase
MSSPPPFDDVAGSIELDHAGPIAMVVISNPRRMNALNLAMWEKLEAAFRHLSTEEDLRCVVVRGAGGKAFAAGADIHEFELARSTLAQVTDFHERIVGGALAAICQCPVPVVAAIRGVCAGGGLSIASVCDVRIAGRSARLGIPIAPLGFSLAMGETQLLCRLIGSAAAAELLLEGRMLSADEACAMRLVSRVVDDDLVESESAATAARICAGAPLVAREHKRQLRRFARSLADVSPEERLRSYAFVDSEDYRIGIRAFRDKVAPRFVGR